MRNHPEVTDAQISKLLGTTKATIDSVRNRTHWNSANIKPVDPVTLGLVGQLALDELVRKAADKKAKDDARKGGATIQPVEANRPNPSSCPRRASVAAPNRPPPRCSAPRTDVPPPPGEGDRVAIEGAAPSASPSGT